MTRSDNVKKNLLFNIIKFATQIVLQFVLRTALIYLLGAEYLGLNGLFANIFSFLSLAELGIGTAIAFSMYKPIADGDMEQVKALQNLYKKFYRVIAIVVAGLGFIIMPMLNIFINGDVTVNINIYLLYALYLINAVAGYFSASKRSVLFAFQRNDIENKVKTICLFGMTIIQIAVLFLTRNYYIYFSVTILFTFIENILIHFWANKLFPEINGKSQPIDPQTKKEITKNVSALSLHRVGGAVIYATDNILISALLGLVTLGVYSNYYLIVSTIISIYTLLTNALTSSVGNMIACESKEYVYKKFKQINFLFTILTSFCTVCMIVLMQPFIRLWTGGGMYLLGFSSVVLMSLSFYIVRARTAVMMFKDTAGLFWQNRFVPIVEATLNLVISIVLGLCIGIDGIILGTIISAVLVPTVFEARVLYKHYFNKSVKSYVFNFILDFVIMATITCICLFVCSFIPDAGLWYLILRFAVCIVLSLILLLLAYLPSKEFKNTLEFVKGFLKKKNRKE